MAASAWHRNEKSASATAAAAAKSRGGMRHGGNEGGAKPAALKTSASGVGGGSRDGRRSAKINCIGVNLEASMKIERVNGAEAI
jgi:hypothetical protein